MRIPGLIVTREHGSWAVVFVPIVVALGVVRSYSVSEVLVFCAAFSSFMMYVPLQTVLRTAVSVRTDDRRSRDARFWVLTFSVVVLASGLALVFTGFPLIVLFALAASFFFLGNFLLVRHFQKTIISDFVAVAGLTLGSPAMYYAATGTIDGMALALWMLNLLFFGSSVFYVHMKMHASSLKRSDLTPLEKFSIGKMNIVYHLTAVTAVAALAWARHISVLAILAYLPMTIHAVVGTIRLTSKVHYKALGFALLGQSLFFGLVLILAEHH